MLLLFNQLKYYSNRNLRTKFHKANELFSYRQWQTLNSSLIKMLSYLPQIKHYFVVCGSDSLYLSFEENKEYTKTDQNAVQYIEWHIECCWFRFHFLKFRLSFTEWHLSAYYHHPSVVEATAMEWPLLSLIAVLYFFCFCFHSMH